MKTATLFYTTLLCASLISGAPVQEATNDTKPELEVISHSVKELYHDGVDPSMPNATAIASIRIIFPTPTPQPDLPVHAAAFESAGQKTVTTGAAGAALLATALGFFLL
ncbi:hypothetical protein EC973_001714 [Apophysomyces ossiformis]|uniref:Uncharacterized protein n=1 Tax=Apophysomyces ossiformis TaxID=679940 RepID=A0A8H7EN11_9FUNG|nr:hypothetical protein EC973_001714 [Apophysomyces ossiformis]